MGLGGIKLAEYADPRAVSRGVGIAAHAASIADRRVRRRDDASVITGRVASASGVADYFNVDVVFADFESRIIDYDCDCPAAARFDGMCKHCVALTVAYFAQPKSFEEIGDGRAAVSPGRTTSEALAQCLAARSNATPVRVGALAVDAAAGTVHLAVHLAYDGRFWSMDLTVEGPRGTYVVRDLEAFAHRVQRGEHFSYGKKLAFAHRLEAFDGPSRAVARKVAELFPDERLFGGSMFRTAGSKRAVRLREAELADLLATMGEGAEFTFGGWEAPPAVANRGAAAFDASEGGERQDNGDDRWVVAGDVPALTLRFVPADGGFELALSERVLVVRGLEEAFVLSDGVAARATGADARAFAWLREAGLTGDGAAGAVFIAERDAEAFCRRALPVLEETIDVALPEAWEALRPVAGTLAFYFDVVGKKEAALIRLTVKAFYGEREVVLESPADSAEEPELRPASSQAFRDQDLEDAGVAVAAQFFDGSMTLPLRQTELAGDLLYGGLVQFRAIGEVFTTPAFDRLIVERPPRVSLGLSLRANLIQMDVRESDLSADELRAMLSAYRRRKRFHRMSDGRIAALGEGDVAALGDMMRDLGVSADALLEGGAELPTYQAFYLDREYGDAVRDRAFEGYLCCLDGSGEPVAAPASLAGTLRPYQVEGFRWLARLASLGFGGILADEMGLGKTLQMIALVKSLRDSGQLGGPVLVVCPASLVFNWADEFARFAPDVPVCALEGSRAHREALLFRATQGIDEGRVLGCGDDAGEDARTTGERIAGASSADVPCVIVASYDRVRIDGAQLARVEWGLVVLDEAQYIKNHATISARSVKSLDALHRFALTGTPIENRLSELWSIFDFLMPGLLSTYESFRSRYEQPILDGDERALERLQALVGHFIMRRMKQDVLTDLPDKDESIVYTQLEDEQMKLYRALEQRLRESINSRTRQAFSADKIAVLAEITRLRELCCDPALLFENYEGGAAKLETIIELVESAHDSGEKTLVFSQFVQFLDIIASCLDEHGISYYTITGSTPKRQRIQLVNEFNEDDTPVFLVSLKAGGTGLNLTGASVVIHSDPWWNLAAENQATDRAHRIGQKRAVSVYKVIAKDTIEERVVALQHAKSKLADKLVRGDGTPLASLTRDELLQLLER